MASGVMSITARHTMEQSKYDILTYARKRCIRQHSTMFSNDLYAPGTATTADATSTIMSKVRAQARLSTAAPPTFL